MGGTREGGVVRVGDGCFAPSSLEVDDVRKLWKLIERSVEDARRAEEMQRGSFRRALRLDPDGALAAFAVRV